MSITHIPVVGAFTYRDADATPAAGEKIHFIAVSDAIVDSGVVTLPKKLVCTLNDDGEVPDTFTLPTVPGGVYYKVSEKFAGKRDEFTIQVLPSDTEIDLATIAPAIPEIPLVSYVEQAAFGALVVRVEDLEEAGPGGGGGASLSNATPAALGTAAAGVGTSASRDDHVHAMPTAAQVGADPAGSAAAAQAAAVATASADAASKANAAQAAAIAASATAAQGATADSALQPGDGLASLDSTAATKLGGIAAGAEVNVNADWNAVSGDAQILNKPALGTAAAANTGDFDAAGAAAAAQAAAAADATTKANAAVTAANAYTDSGLAGKEGTQTAASQAEAEAGSETAIRKFSPLRIFQAIAAKLALGTWISGATGKSTPVDADTLALSDSAAASALKSVTWANLKATLKTYFDTLYAALASPAFTGTPTAPTAAAGTTTTQLATTAFVRTPSIQSVTSAATVTPTFSDDMVKVTAQAAALAFANPTGTAIPGVGMVLRIKDNGTARAISYDTQYRTIGITLPTTTVPGKTAYIAMIFNSDDTKWDCIATGTQA